MPVLSAVSLDSSCQVSSFQLKLSLCNKLNYTSLLSMKLLTALKPEVCCLWNQTRTALRLYWLHKPDPLRLTWTFSWHCCVKLWFLWLGPWSSFIWISPHRSSSSLVFPLNFKIKRLWMCLVSWYIFCVMSCQLLTIWETTWRFENVEHFWRCLMNYQGSWS